VTIEDAAMQRIVDDSLREMLADATGTRDRASCSAIHALSTAAIARFAWLFDARRVTGLARQCHGDLHLHNAFLDGDTPRLFDAIEFK
jgi:aminoglycoside phosphotransferase family enzyme